MKYIDNQKCKQIVADCCKVIKDELSRWSGKTLTDANLKDHYDPSNWKQISQDTCKGVRSRTYRFKKTGLRVEAMVVSRHCGYSVSAHLWLPMTRVGEPDAPVFGPFEK